MYACAIIAFFTSSAFYWSMVLSPSHSSRHHIATQTHTHVYSLALLLQPEYVVAAAAFCCCCFSWCFYISFALFLLLLLRSRYCDAGNCDSSCRPMILSPFDQYVLWVEAIGRWLTRCQLTRNISIRVRICICICKMGNKPGKHVRALESAALLESWQQNAVG